MIHQILDINHPNQLNILISIEMMIIEVNLEKEGDLMMKLRKKVVKREDIMKIDHQEMKMLHSEEEEEVDLEEAMKIEVE